MMWTWTEEGYAKRFRLEMKVDKFLLSVMTPADKLALAQSIDSIVYEAVRVAASNLNKIMNNSE